MSLDEIPNDITKKTPACFEPTIDYVVVKIPKWQFEKFAGADSTLGTQMKSVGEVMAIGPHLQRGAAKRYSLTGAQHALARPRGNTGFSAARKTCHAAAQPHSLDTYGRGTRISRRRNLRPTKIDPWFIHQIEEIIVTNRRAASVTVETASKDLLREVKRVGTSDETLAQMWKTTPAAVRLQRARYGSPRFSSGWTPAPPNLSPSPRTCIPLTKKRTKPKPRSARKS